MDVRERLLTDIKERAAEMNRRAHKATEEIRSVEQELKRVDACVQLEGGIRFEWEEGGKPRSAILTYRKAGTKQSSLGFCFHVRFEITAGDVIPLTGTKREVRIAAVEKLDEVLTLILKSLKRREEDGTDHVSQH